MHTYAFELNDSELRTLISTYNIPVDLRLHLPDPNFQMINLPSGDTAICIYHRIFDSLGVRIPFSSFLLEVVKYYKVHLSQLVPLGLNKGNWFSFAKRRGAVPFHMPWRHPDLYVVDELPTAFDQGHVDRLSAHVIKLRNIPEGVLAQFGISKVWRNPLCDLVIRRPNGTVMSIYDFICMPSLDQTKLSEEPHDLGIPLQERVVDHTTAPAPPGTAVHAATLEEIVVTRPDHEVVTKAKNATNRKASTRSKVSTNVAKNTKVGKKNSRARSGLSDSPHSYTKKEWDGVHTVNLVLLNKEFFKDPKEANKRLRSREKAKEVVATNKAKVDEELVKAKRSLMMLRHSLFFGKVSQSAESSLRDIAQLELTWPNEDEKPGSRSIHDPCNDKVSYGKRDCNHANEAVSVMLLVERKGRKMSIHDVNRSLQGAEVFYASMEKLAQALVNVIKGQVLADFQADTMMEDNIMSEGTSGPKELPKTKEATKSSKTEKGQTAIDEADT
nr:hypothetical protein [Tanacetum cinerariifolium]